MEYPSATPVDVLPEIAHTPLELEDAAPK